MNATKKEEFTKVQRVSDNKYNLITADGKNTIQAMVFWADNFHDGLAVVGRTNGELCKIDKSGKLYKD